VDTRDAQELARVTTLSYERACEALRLWEFHGYTGWRAQEIISRCLGAGYDPVEVALRVSRILGRETDV
jgi:hypothetical protein